MKGEGIRRLLFALDFGWRSWLQSSGFPLSREWRGRSREWRGRSRRRGRSREWRL